MKNKNKFKSNLEERASKLIPNAEYEPKSFTYTITAEYTPDFKVNDNIWVETKGLFRQQDMRKMKCVREQYPNLIWIMCFQDKHKKVRKNSKITYEGWALKNGFVVCELCDLIKTINQHTKK